MAFGVPAAQNKLLNPILNGHHLGPEFVSKTLFDAGARVITPGQADALRFLVGLAQSDDSVSTQVELLTQLLNDIDGK